MTKVALLGRGKTGSQVIKLLDEKNIEFTNFHREHPPTLELLTKHDAVISFLPGDALASYLPLLKEANLPVISGSTGYDFSQVKDLVWIQGNNFSLGMNVARLMIECMSTAATLFQDDFKSSIHEVHHTKKLDAPSGTALSWQRWLGLSADITSERTGDVVGDHQLTVETPFEKITLRHQALDRQIFAQGALWAVDYAMAKKLDRGFYWFEDIVRSELITQQKG